MHIVYLRNCFLYGSGQVFHVDGLGSKVEGAVVHGLTDVPHITVGTHHDDAQCGVFHLVYLGQQRQTVHLGHINVTEDNLNVGVAVQDGKRFHTITGKEELILTCLDFAPEVLFHQ